MPKLTPNPFEGVLTDRHYNECKRCVDNAVHLGDLLDKAEKTGMDVAPGREMRARQLERLEGYLREFFPDRAG